MSTDTKHELVQGLMEGRLSRWEFVTRAVALGLSAGAAGSLLAAYDAATGARAEAAGSTKGQLVIAINSNVPKEAQDALNTAYKARQPNVTLVWDIKNYTDPSQYTSYLDTQLAASHIQPDIVSGNYQPPSAAT